MTDDTARTLAAADTDPPPGQPLTATGLLARAATRARRRAAVALGATLLLPPLAWWCWPHHAAAVPPPVAVDVTQELRLLGERLDDLRVALRRAPRLRPATEPTADDRLHVRTALAVARAEALSTRSLETPR